MHRRVMITGGLAAFFNPLAIAAGAMPEMRRVTLAIGGKTGLHYLPLTIAEQLGYFEDAGLELMTSDFAGGARALEAVVGQSADLAIGSYSYCIEMQAKGQRLLAFALLGRTTQIAIAAIGEYQARVRSALDLKGLRVGVSAPGSATHVALNLYLAKVGLPSSAVSVIGVGTGAGALAAVRNREIDVLCGLEPVMTMLETHGQARVLADARTLAGTAELYGGPYLGAALLAPSGFLENKPHTARAFATAIVRALGWLRTASEDEIVSRIPQSYLLGDAALYRTALSRVREGYSTDGFIGKAGSQTALRVLAFSNPALDPAQIRLEDTYTNRFVGDSGGALE